MKQKLFLSALLLGALTLNSCVDDTESPSVTAVRQAKAEQIKSLADLNKAQAEAAIITANATAEAQKAQAELAKAQAEYAKAQAAYEMARAEYQKAQTETEKARAQQAMAQAEEAMAQAQYEKQRYANLLQELAGQLEINLLRQKADMLAAQKAYQEAIQNNDDATRTRLSELFRVYREAQEAVFTANKTLAGYEINLARLKAGLDTSAEVYANLIQSENDNITGWQEDILEAQTYIDTWKNFSVADAKKDLPAVWQEVLTLDTKQKDAAKVVLDATNANNAAWKTLTGSAYMAAVNDLKPYNGNINYISGNIQIKWVSEQENGAPKDARGYYCAFIQEIENIYIPNEWGYGNWEEKVLSETYIPLFTNASYTNEELTYELVGTSDWNSGIVSEGSESYYEYSSYYDLVPGSVEKVIAAVAATQKSDKKWLADATKYLEDAQKAQEDAQKAYDNSVKLEKAAQDADAAVEAAQKTKDAAQKVVDEAGDKATEAQKKALADAETALNKAIEAQTKAWEAYNEAGNVYDKERELKLATANTVEATKTKNNAEYQVSENEKFITELNAKAKDLNDGAAGNVESMNAVNAANLALAEAKKDNALAKNAYDQKYAEYNALNSLIATDNEGQNIDSMISEKETDIKGFQDQIAEAQKKIAGYEKELASAGDKDANAIKALEQQIADQKAQIEIYQKEYDNAKAALDKAMAE
ncbi:MAG: hypothetical protein K1W14_17470 [Muribaculaceae bacterium]|jgi:hypothetical protein|uniref:hypothetical protein n=1 Tax=Xylanibacter rodentium TaxID=2736289 RepID=UPI000F47B767|nr:hypothetical protein [Xylanibacter rodentium]